MVVVDCKEAAFKGGALVNESFVVVMKKRGVLMGTVGTNGGSWRSAYHERKPKALA